MPAIAGRKLPRRLGLRGLLLYLLPLPLLLKAIGGLWGGEFATLVGNAIPYAMFVLGALVARRGLERELRYLERPLALSPPPPLKALAAGLIGSATGLAAWWAAGHDVLIAAAFAVAAAAGMALYYGLDPKRRALAAGDHGVDHQELSTALATAYRKLDGIGEARRRLPSREFQDRLGVILDRSEAILKEIEADPADLRRARKFLNVYLDGVLGVTNKYIEAHPKAQSFELEQNYRAMLIDMETVCKEQHEKLIQNETFDLDVQIEVLSTRLKREGVI
ncbi:MAG: 5-bromo-4-chloroindolyl phosphate hydrolysis family protein [Rhodospirillales bacterium]|nr:5-bromo-4-chloroindolyl phosphate hydrolysis family protein [Rhodospirillales bacterium]